MALPQLRLRKQGHDRNEPEYWKGGAGLGMPAPESVTLSSFLPCTYGEFRRCLNRSC